MSAAKIPWGQVLAVVFIILMSVWAATQWTASALGYQPELGEPWFGLLGQPIYRPYDLFWWWFSYDAYAPKIFDKGGMIAASGGFVAIVAAIAMSVWRGRENRNANTCGTARWATRDDTARCPNLDRRSLAISESRSSMPSVAETWPHSRLIGDYDADVAFGQSRILLAWNRLILPDGRSIVLERQPASDARGFAGLQDGTDYHWGGVLKAALVSTLLGAGSELGSGDDGNLARAFRRGTQDSINRAGEQIVSRELNVRPTLTIRPGFPVRVLVTRDLVLGAGQ